MSGGLAPSRSTVYVGNLPFSLTNNDLHKIFEKYGKVVKVTVLKDRETRKSKGVAFVLYLDRNSALQCVNALNKTELFGRTLKCTLATDNGRATEFIRRKEYKDKTRCYECGEFGHVSYKCPQNSLGDRQPPKKKEKRKKTRNKEAEEEETDGEKEEEDEEESLGSAIRYEQELKEREQVLAGLSHGGDRQMSENSRKKFRKSAYFSDEEEVDD